MPTDNGVAPAMPVSGACADRTKNKMPITPTAFLRSRVLAGAGSDAAMVSLRSGDVTRSGELAAGDTWRLAAANSFATERISKIIRDQTIWGKAWRQEMSPGLRGLPGWAVISQYDAISRGS